MDQKNLDGHMTLLDHLTELRTRIIYISYGIAIGIAASWAFAERILWQITRPIDPYIRNGLNVTGVTDKFMVQVKVSLVCGCILSSPWMFYQIWKFIAPGLYVHERKWAAVFVFFGTALFLTGIAFVYFVIFPFSFQFLMKDVGYTFLEEQINLNDYLAFVLTCFMAFGFIFEMPVILGFFGKMGLVNATMLRRFRRFAIVLNAIVAAIIAPPDLMSMVFMLVPMMALYEISILVVAYVNPVKTSTSITPKS